MLKQTKNQLFRQIKQNLVAIVSLVTALSGVFYDSWRDHVNETHENQRNAAFEVLKNLAELQTVVNYAHFAQNSEHGNAIDGWKYVLLVRDLSHLLPQKNQQQGEALYLHWQRHWDQLQHKAASEQTISTAISSARSHVLNTIKALE